jgi:anhydro-N-acetylmuramic acid kinase
MPRVIGLMSGTSVDGVDAALVRIAAAGPTLRVDLDAFLTHPFPPGMRDAILAASDPRRGTVDLLCRLNVALGEVFADAAVAVAAQGGVPLAAVDLIGSHGQTVHHLPQPTPFHGYAVRATLQLGEPCVIAERTGVTTVADFRPRDLAAGGEGAPLAPYGHWLLFADPQRARVVHNIGGISNVTVLPAGGALTDVVAFDTGPGNLLIDAAVARLTQGRETYDRDGRRAAQGRVCRPLLDQWLQHPFLQRPPPKSTGREAFGDAFLDQLLDQAARRGLRDDDLLATLTAYSAATMADAYRRFILPRHADVEGVLCGGGSRNPTLLAHLRRELPQVSWRTSDALGIAAEAVEAVIFAVLAYATVCGHPANVPAATGARHAVILGKVVPGRRGWDALRRPA